MKKLFLSLGVCFTLAAGAQTAANFTANDCNSVSHDLFTELNSGKVVVITWVMPCSACVNGAQSSQAAVQSFSTSNPGMVFHYVADDVANTSCGTLANWCATNSVVPNAVFSHSTVNMSSYGAAGMPKVVVLGGGNNHGVYYNVNGSAVTTASIQSAITAALNATGILEAATSYYAIKLSPNPVNTELNIIFNATENLKTDLDIYNLLGQKVKSTETQCLIGKNEIKLGTEFLPGGSYFLKISNGKNSEIYKFLIAH